MRDSRDLRARLRAGDRERTSAASIQRVSRRFNDSGRIVGTKLDVLDYLDTVPVGVGYRFKGATLDWMPAISEEYAEVESVYQELPGWSSPTAGSPNLSGRPERPRITSRSWRTSSKSRSAESRQVLRERKRSSVKVPVLERVTGPQDIAGAEVARTEVQANPKFVFAGIGGVVAARVRRSQRRR